MRGERKSERSVCVCEREREREGGRRERRGISELVRVDKNVGKKIVFYDVPNDILLSHKNKRMEWISLVGLRKQQNHSN